MASLKEYAVISDPRIDIGVIDYYLQKDNTSESATLQSYYGKGAITSSKAFSTNNRITYYKLTEDSASALLKSPDILSVDLSFDQLQADGLFTASIEDPDQLSSIQTGYFSTVNDSLKYPTNTGELLSSSIYHPDLPSLNYGLIWHTKYKNGIDWSETRMIDTSTNTSTPVETNFNYNLTGKGVDLVIIDTGVKFHPEFLDNNGNLRIVEYDWYQHLDAVDGNGDPKVLPSNFYTSQSGGHGTHVASIAAGNLCGWAKDATIYSIKALRESTVWDSFIQPQELMTLSEAFEAVRLFHESKIIDPNTGFKRPTIVNASFGYRIPIFSDQNYSSGFPISYIDDIFYKGVARNLSGSNNLPGPQDNIRFNTLTDIPFVHKRKFWVHPNVTELDILCEQLTDAGVIFIRAAGNEKQIITKKSNSKYPQYYGDGIYDSYLTRTTSTYYSYYPSGSAIHTNRIGSPESTDSVTVGSISPMILVPGPVDSNSITTYSIYGHNHPDANGNDDYYHGNIENWESKPIKGFSSGSDFPGWDLAQAYNKNLTISTFTNVGPAIDIFAAGGSIMAAGHPYHVYANSNLGKSYLFKSHSLYDPNFDPSINNKLDETDYMTLLGGTSMASPQVAGVACLYFQLNPGANVDQFKTFLSASAASTSLKMFVEKEDENIATYSGSIQFDDNLTLNRTYTNVYETSQSIALNGAPPLVLNWPYDSPNPAKIS